MSLIIDPLIAQRNLLVIPIFNCAPQIGGLIESLAPLANSWDKIWFVDNGSTDGTIDQALSNLNKFPVFENSAKLFVNSENIGLGGTHKIVFQGAIKESFKTLTIFHGDHQAKLEDAIQALHLASSNPDNFILGSRFSRTSKLYGYSKIRTLFNHSMNLIYSVVLRRRVFDLGSGLNIFPIQQLKELEPNKLPNDLTFNIELLKWLFATKKNIIWLPISWGETDQISNVQVTKQVLKTIKLALIPYGKVGAKISPNFHQNDVKLNGK